MSRWTSESACWLGHAAAADPRDDAVDPLQSFDRWCAANPGCRATVWLGSGLLLPLLVGPDLPLRDEPALRTWAQRVFKHYGVPEAAPLATWRSGRRLGAVALEGLDLPALQAVARRHRVHLAGVRPGWALALHTLRSRDARRAGAHSRVWMTEPGLTTELQLDQGALSGITLHWADGVQDIVPGPGELVFAAPVQQRPGRGPKAPDFLTAPVRHESAAGWALAATGAVVLAVALADAGALPVEPSAAAARPLAESGAVPVDPAWAARAAHPWAQVFAAAETASVPGVRWLHLDHDAARGGLRLQGQARDIAQALAAADSLASGPGVRDALLAHSERPGAGAELRFELQAQLDLPPERPR